MSWYPANCEPAHFLGKLTTKDGTHVDLDFGDGGNGWKAVDVIDQETADAVGLHCDAEEAIPVPSRCWISCQYEERGESRPGYNWSMMTDQDMREMLTKALATVNAGMLTA